MDTLPDGVEVVEKLTFESGPNPFPFLEHMFDGGDTIKFLIISTAAIKTPPDAYGGMEREVHWLNMALREMGHETMVVAKSGSETPGVEFPVDDESEITGAIQEMMQGGWPPDVILDFSHDKRAGRMWPDFPQVNVYQVMTVGHPVCPVFISGGQKVHINQTYGNRFMDAPVVHYGLDIAEYPLSQQTWPRGGYILYMGSIIQEKRVPWVKELGHAVDMPVKIAGPCWDELMFEFFDHIKETGEWVGDVGGEEKLGLLQGAAVLVHPIGGRDWVEAGAIIAIEAMLVGTPVMSTPNGCMLEYIRSFQNGFTANTVGEMEILFPYLKDIDPVVVRGTVKGHFTKERMARDYVDLARRVMAGNRW